jgi:hypothetical protein
MTEPVDVLDALDQPLVGAAVGAALELGLFWLLETESRDAAEVGRALGIPVGRCRAWLKVLATAGLVQEHVGLYAGPGESDGPGTRWRPDDPPDASGDCRSARPLRPELRPATLQSS